MRTLLSTIFCLLFLAGTCSTASRIPDRPGNEVIYHVFLRSFYDHNGDTNGDLKGLQSKLDYLQDLGITSVLLTPINSSVYYHNYFSDDFEKIDPGFGTRKDYLDLVADIHKRGMKIYLDMETQYVTEDHLWWKDSYGNPASRYSNYILYDDTENKKPATIVFNLDGLKGYNNVWKRITTVNLKDSGVLAYNIKLFTHFADPNGDGRFDDGVDGFRLDHAMDSLDGKPRLGNLFATFWHPLITQLKKTNPGLTIIAEQANWGEYGADYFTKAGVDRVFAFRIWGAIASFNKKTLIKEIDTTLSLTPPGKQQLVFIENHDVPRFASIVKNDPGKLKVAATLNLLIGQTPSIYYGQELGMFGVGKKFNNTDANEIPVREAFEWYKTVEGKGMAVWYKNSGPWWDSTNLKANDGVSLEEELKDPNSLYHYYRTLLHLRKNKEALQSGVYKMITNENDKVFSFLRSKGKQKILVTVNLSATKQVTHFNLSATVKGKMRLLTSSYKTQPLSVSIDAGVDLQPFEAMVWEIKE